MKKLLTLACFSLLLFAGSCSSDGNTANDSVLYNDNTAFNEKGSSVFEGVIGEMRNGVPVVTANPGPILQEFENTLLAAGFNDDLTSLAIVRKTATNDPTHEAYFLMASGSGHTTTASVAVRASGGVFQAEPSSDNDYKQFICRGCAQGCVFAYLTIDGHKIPYCNEMSCNQYDCREIKK